ncbi:MULTISPECIES: hypothetical protein [unclassified Thioalkalivibrio]|uniref:hypothetical protein n=1 Tax=unclassified Thioalkalivibrio TaxID=2621013 RepID=UPI00037ED54D|nr:MULTISPECIES: hypothetical protein [unclassified Thioalkalivibrio]
MYDYTRVTTFIPNFAAEKDLLHVARLGLAQLENQARKHGPLTNLDSARRAVSALEVAIVSAIKDDEKLNQAYRDEAEKDFGRDGELEFDYGATISHGTEEGGAYVQGWRWVSDTPAIRALKGLPEEESESRFLNYYRCEDCDTDWEDEWDSTCDDDCPSCGKDFSPYMSEEL